MKRALLPPLALWLLLAGGCSALPTAREMTVTLDATMKAE